LSPRLIQTAYRPGAETEDSLDDFTPVDFSAQTEAKMEETPKNETLQKLPEVMVALDDGGAIAVPDFTGKTMREVTESCLRLGLDPVLVGSSLASRQTPEAGAKVRRGSKVIVEFAAGVAKTDKHQ